MTARGRLGVLLFLSAGARIFSEQQPAHIPMLEPAVGGTG